MDTAIKSKIVYRHGMDRDAEGVPCDCGGYANSVACTQEERDKFGCGRSWDCCSRAFVCRICGTRIVGSARAPEMD